MANRPTIPPHLANVHVLGQREFHFTRCGRYPFKFAYDADEAFQRVNSGSDPTAALPLTLMMGAIEYETVCRALAVLEQRIAALAVELAKPAAERDEAKLQELAQCNLIVQAPAPSSSTDESSSCSSEPDAAQARDHADTARDGGAS